MDIKFEDFKYHCRHGHDAYDEDHNCIYTCRHKGNKTNIHSWGDCNKEVCPIIIMAKMKG